MQGLSHGKVALTLCLFGLSQSGCDIVQGFRDASAAVFPDEKTYFDAPGFRLVRGGYRQLEFASGSSLYLLARTADPESTDLHVMRYADPRPCVLPNIKAHTVGVGTFVDATTIAYIEEGTDRGTLRFADGDCQTYDFKLEDAGLTWIESPDGFAVFQGKTNNLVIVNPITKAVKPVADGVTSFSQFSSFYILGARGQVGAFKTDWTLVRWIGDEVKSGGPLGNSFIYEDRAGIHRVTSDGYDIDDKVIAADGCNLGFPRNLAGGEGWATYHTPCAAKRLVVYSDSAMQATPLDVPADPRFLAFLPVPPNSTGNPTTDPFFIFYATDHSDQTGTGTLTVRLPDRQTKTIGTNAAFERLIAFPSAEDTHGFALVDVEGDTGTYVRWESDGSKQVVAARVVRGTNDLISNYDGKTGQFGLLSDKALNVVARQVPAYGFRMRDDKGRWTAIIDDFAESMGTLSITESTLDFSEAARTPSPPPSLEVIARSVLWDSRTSFVQAIPGIAYMINYDKKSDTGRLEYRNLELRFTATVSDGVANYLRTPGGLIYSVPYGDGAGIWVVRSR
jgi:hypothetical protein